MGMALGLLVTVLGGRNFSAGRVRCLCASPSPESADCARARRTARESSPPPGESGRARPGVGPAPPSGPRLTIDSRSRILAGAESTRAAAPSQPAPAGSARSSGNPRARHLTPASTYPWQTFSRVTRRSRGLSDVLAARAEPGPRPRDRRARAHRSLPPPAPANPAPTRPMGPGSSSQSPPTASRGPSGPGPDDEDNDETTPRSTPPTPDRRRPGQRGRAQGGLKPPSAQRPMQVA